MLVDTHAHLNFKDYQDDLDKVIKRSIKNGVAKIICVSSNLEESEKAIEISRRYPKVVYPAVGLHPQQTDPWNKTSPEEQIKALGKLAQEKEVIALGECGLDYSPAPPKEKDRPKEEQFFLFKKQIELAIKLKLSLLVHSRKAFQDTLDILNQYAGPDLKGAWHCYYAGRKGIEPINQLGFYFGLDGNITYDPGLQNVFSQIPLDKILLETDCPFLTPEPHRGTRNESAHVKIIAECLAQIKSVPFKEVARITTKNAKNLFKI